MPRLENWYMSLTNVRDPTRPFQIFVEPMDGSDVHARLVRMDQLGLDVRLHGEVYDHPRFSDGSVITSSSLVDWRPNEAICSTMSYQLGKPEPSYRTLRHAAQAEAGKWNRIFYDRKLDLICQDDEIRAVVEVLSLSTSLEQINKMLLSAEGDTGIAKMAAVTKKLVDDQYEVWVAHRRRH